MTFEQLVIAATYPTSRTDAESHRTDHPVATMKEK